MTGLTWTDLLVLAVVGGVALLVVAVAKWVRRAKADEPPPPLAPLSALSVLSFLAGLGALLAALGAVGCGWMVRYRHALDVGESKVGDFLLAAQILAWATLVPAVGAVALAIAARGAVREAQGGLRGRSLYHTAVLVALLSAGGVWAWLA